MRKANDKVWRNAIQGFCEMNRLWQYILGQVLKPKTPTLPKKGELEEKTKEVYNTKLLQWLTIIVSLRRIIRLTYSLDLMSHVSNLNLYSEI